MNITLLQHAVTDIKTELEDAIRSAEFRGKTYDNGQRAKEALIRSQRLIMKIHEVAKTFLSTALAQRCVRHVIYPPLGQSAPELSITGLIKAKKQDLVFI